MRLTRARSGPAALVLAALVLASGAVRLSAQPVPQPPDPATLVVSAPVTLRELGRAQVRGVPTRMAWSPDGTWLYLRVSTFDRWSNETVRHALASPTVASWRIKIDTREDQVRTTNVPREGSIGQHGDPGADLDETVRKVANSSQKVLFEDYVLNGKVIASSVNGHVSAGRTFAWAPAPLSLVAFVDARGRLVLMNQTGATRAALRSFRRRPRPRISRSRSSTSADDRPRRHARRIRKNPGRADWRDRGST